MPFLDSQIAHWTTDPDALPALREMSICDLLEEAVERWPERDALLVVVDELPTTPSGKVQKFRLREQWIAAQRQDAPTERPG